MKSNSYRQTSPMIAPAMISRVASVKQVAATGSVSATPYRNPLIPAGQTGGLSVLAVTLAVTVAVKRLSAYCILGYPNSQASNTSLSALL